MANSDSQVEVKIVGTLDGSVTTSTNAAKAQLASLSTASQDLGRSLQAEASAWMAQKEATTVAADGLDTVTKAAASSHGSVSTATREFRALFDELSSGRTRQTPGTLAIIGQRVLGLGPAALLAVGAVAALTAGLGYLVLSAVRAADALDKAKEAADFAGNLSLGTQQLQGATTALDQFANVSSKDAQTVIQAFARMRDMSAPELDALTRLVGEYAETQGVKAPEAAKTFIAALENEKLSAADLVKLIPGITQAQVENIEMTQRMGDAHQTASALLTVMSGALNRTRQDFAEQSAGVFASFKNYMAYVGALSSGTSIEELHSQIVEDQAKAWDKNQVAILGDLDALKKLAAAPPPQDLIDPIQKAEDAIAHLNATWTGSTASRYAAEARLWQQVAAGTDLNAKQRAEAERSADDAIFHSHQSLATESLKLTKESNEEQLRAIEEQALGAEKGSAEQIASYEKLYIEAVKLDGARSQQALSAERQLTAARAAAAEEWLSELAAVETQAIARDNERYQASIENLQGEFRQHQISAAQELQLSQQTENDRFQLTQNSLTMLLALWAGYPEKLAEINKEIEANENTHQKNMDAIARTGARDMTQEYQQAWQPVLSGFDTMVNGILSGNQTLTQVLERGAVTIAEDYIRNQLRQLEQTLVSEQAKTAAVAAGNAQRSASNAVAATADSGISLGKYVADIEADAAKTYADVFAWAAPTLGPFAVVPATAAAALVGAQAALLPSLDVGTNVIPADMMAMVHQGERIMPAADNTALMAALDSNTANDNSGQLGSASAGSGDMAIHIDSLTVQTGMSGNPQVIGRQVVNAIAREARNGNATLTQAAAGQ